ncbi:hypothetical protein OKW96_17455 [Sphingobacterium sp. KU25419]|nr:hypothetical protein OKW96_17455 [Sphingobacterium sp. KU25419]
MLQKYDYKITATIFSKAGDDFAVMEEVYDKFSNIYNIKAVLYDAAGNKIKEYKIPILRIKVYFPIFYF